MKMQGLFETDFKFAFARIHLGEKNGSDFSQISFPNLGSMNNDSETTVITERCADIIFILNGMPCKIHLEKAGDDWSGSLTLDSISLNVALEVTQISSDPGFTDTYEMIPEINVARLKEHMDYDDHGCDGLLEYEFHNQEVLDFIRGKGICSSGNLDFATARSLMRQVSALYHHDGVNAVHDRENQGTIAQIRFAEAHNNFTNCRGMAIILAGVLRAYGFRANVVECWPEKNDTSDIHVVCEVFAEDLNKTVLLDPSSNLIYFLGETPLSLMELRQAICEQREFEISINTDASYNGEEVTKTGKLAYMSKNLMFLRKSLKSDEQTDFEETDTICLTSRDLLEDRYPASAYFTCNIQEFYSFK